MKWPLGGLLISLKAFALHSTTADTRNNKVVNEKRLTFSIISNQFKLLKYKYSGSFITNLFPIKERTIIVALNSVFGLKGHRVHYIKIVKGS